MSLGLVVMGIVIILTFSSVVLVIYFGAKENVNPTFGAIDSSQAAQVWQKRALAMQTLSSKLLGEGGDMQPATKTAANGGNADKEAKRQAALARKAARGSQSSEA